MKTTKEQYILDNLDIILNKLSKNYPLSEIARDLNVKYDTLKKYLVKFKIEFKTNPNRKGFKRPNERKPILELLNSNCSNSAKRRRLIEDGIKDAKCEICGLSEWMGMPIPLELHHKDFNHYNNDLSNLQILCANCHMQAHNYNNNSKLK